MQMRRVKFSVLYNGADITADISNHIMSLTYTDYASGKADDLELQLQDKKGRWRSDWFPAKGASLKADIIAEDWDKEGSNKTLPCGKFEIDNIEFTGPADKVTIRAIAAPIKSSSRSQDKTKAWENITLSGIAGEIAKKAGLSLVFESSDDPTYGRVDQVQMTDLKFLYKLCSDAGISIKVTDKKLVIFDEAEYESKGAVRKLVRCKDDIISYSFSTDSKEIYTEATVSYHDTETGEQIEGSFKPPNAPKTGHKLKVYERCDFSGNYAPKAAKDATAKKLAKKKLREKNKNETTARLTLVGDVRLVGGSNIELSGWGIFDGKYHIETATHKVDSSGYVVDIELHKVLEGY